MAPCPGVYQALPPRAPQGRERGGERQWCDCSDDHDLIIRIMGTFIVTFYLDLFWLRIGNQTWNVSCFEVSCSCTLLNPMGQSPPPLHSHHHSQRHHHHHHKYHEHSSSPILPNQINDHQFSFFVPSTLSPFPAASLFSFHHQEHVKDRIQGRIQGHHNWPQGPQGCVGSHRKVAGRRPQVSLYLEIFRILIFEIDK